MFIIYQKKILEYFCLLEPLTRCLRAPIFNIKFKIPDLQVRDLCSGEGFNMASGHFQKRYKH